MANSLGLVPVLFSLLISILSLLPLARSSSITGYAYCDYCLNGKFDAGQDDPITWSKITANCSLKSSGRTQYVAGTGNTGEDGNFKISIKGSSNTNFLNALFIGGNPNNGMMAGAYVEGCMIQLSCGDCPTMIFNNGGCNANGQQGNGWTTGVDIVNTGASTADIKLTSEVCNAPTEKDESCPAEAPPPPGGNGDPHYIGADGSHFDFSGEPNTTFCLISDAHLHINVYYGGRYDRWGKNEKKALTWIRQMGILWGHHTISFAARSGARWQYDTGYMARIDIDGEEVKLGQAGDFCERADGKIKVTWLAAKVPSADDLIDIYEVQIQDVLKMRIKLRPEVELLRIGTDGLVHLDFELPLADISDSAHGILGQTYRSDHRSRLPEVKLVFSELLNTYVVPGDNAEGFIDGNMEDYRSSGLLRADCRFARFTRASFRDTETARAIELTSTGVTSAIVETSSLARRRFA